jgi:hypothetical protein
MGQNVGRNAGGTKMNKKLVLMIFLFTKSLLAMGPMIECRFGAVLEGGQIGLDESVLYSLDHRSGVTGDFLPYGIEISVEGPDLTVGVYLTGQPISGIQIPVINVEDLPIGASLFGLNTIYHPPALGFFTMRYECLKVSE